MRENNRKPIENCRKKLPQFTTMNVIDGQAGLAIYSSLIFYSLTIDNILNIIVLLILAAVAINLTIGNNGIFTRAQNATQKWEEASKNEQSELDKVSNFLDEYMNGNGGSQDGGDTEETPSSVADAIEKGDYFDKKTQIKDDLDNVVTIPKDFKVAEDSATKVEDGVVIEDHEGNQFVWIPAKTGAGTVVHTTLGDKTMVYKRTAYSTNVATGETDETTNSEKIKYSSSSSYYFTEAMPSDEEASVNANGGYYIGRYEAGDKESTDSKTMRTSSSSETNTVIIKKGQAPYTYATYDEQKTLAEGMDSVRGYEGTTKLTSSYAWDTAISFIQIKNEDYGNSSEEGNYYNTSFEYTDITGAKQTKSKSSSTLVPTGQTTPVCNIYDMGGNCYERTSEVYSVPSSPVSTRGGSYGIDFAERPAGRRNNSKRNADRFHAFRVTLYL